MGIPTGVCEGVEKMGDMRVLQDPGLNLYLKYMASAAVRRLIGRDTPHVWLPYDFRMGKVPYVLSFRTWSTHYLNTDGESIDDSIVPTSPGLSVPGDRTPLQTILEQVVWWVYAYHLSEILGLDELSEIPDD